MMVLDALREVCSHHGWNLWAAQSNESRSRDRGSGGNVMHSSRMPAAAGTVWGLTDPIESGGRHGSTRWLWKDEDVQEAIRYVVSGQGEPMEIHLEDLR